MYSTCVSKVDNISVQTVSSQLLFHAAFKKAGCYDINIGICEKSANM